MTQVGVYLVALAFLVIRAEAEMASSLPPLTGANVCNRSVTRMETIRVRYEKEFKYREKVWCSDITEGFKCTEIKVGLKPAYREERVPKDSLYFYCCPPFVEEDSESGDERRCVDAPRSLRAVSRLAGAGGGGGIGTAGIVAVLMVALALLALVGAVLYYRRKYKSEKDPAYPTVTYESVKAVYSSSEAGGGGGEAGAWQRHEFDNPLYASGSRESSVEVVPPRPPPTGGAKEESIYAEASYGVASSMSSPRYELPSSGAPTASPYDFIQPEQKLAY